MNILQINNISFKNTFYLYPNKKNTKQVIQKIDKISSRYDVCWVEINPNYRKNRPLEIDGRKTVSKEVISIDKNSDLDQNVRNFCIKNNIDFVEYNDRNLTGKIIEKAQIAKNNSNNLNSSVVIIDSKALEKLFKHKKLDNNFDELKENYNKKDQKTKEQLKAYLKAGEKFEAPYFNCVMEDDFKVSLSQEEQIIPSGKFALNGYSCDEIKYNQSDIYFALKEIGIKDIPITADEDTLMLLNDLKIVRGIKIGNEIK